MNWEILSQSKFIENLGWTLVHSVWQIALAAAMLFFVLNVFKNLSATARYLFSYSALVMAFLLPLATFVIFNNHPGNQPQNKTMHLESAAFRNEKVQAAENASFSDNGKSAALNSGNENAGIRFETFGGNFKRELASALPVLVWLWLAGIVFYTLRLLGGIWQVHLYRTRNISAPESEWQKRFERLREKLKVTQTVELRRSDAAKMPMVVGWIKPLILVPTGVFLQIDPRQLETILAHELVHIRRHDNLFNFLQSFVEILFFYHPCAWWISAVIRREREFVCDDRVLEILDGSHVVYADALANLEELRLLANIKTPPFAAAASGGNLMKRIERIIEKNAETQANSKQSFWSASLALLLISAVLINVFSARSAVSVNSETLGTANKKLAIGFVSIPPLGIGTAPPKVNVGATPKISDETARLLIEKLSARKIPAIGFVLGGMISDGENLLPAQADILRLWRDAGFEIGIGNFRHLWFYDTSYENFVAGVEKNEEITKKILAEKNLSLRYFSYPYLNTGKNAAERNRFEAWLKQRNITPVKYTIDNQEWMYSYAYDQARANNDAAAMKQIRGEFLDYMTKMFDHFEKYSQEMFGRDINQTMVLTPSRLVVDSADDLFGMIERRGYQFVSMDEAQRDEAYATPESFYGKSGISWFERWQMAKGKKLLDEPPVSKTVWDTWNAKKPKS